MGNSHPLISPYSVYKTFDDKWIVIGVATDKQFSIFKDIIGI
jgi:crotonobetainyl-CoA:carnitine CoA-transferase CaiB-like acyl-CoA transferase